MNRNVDGRTIGQAGENDVRTVVVVIQLTEYCQEL